MMDGLFHVPLLLAVTEVEDLGFGTFAYLGIILVAIFAMILLARRGITGRVFTNPVTQMAEQAYLFIEHLCVSIIGPSGRKYVPFVLTLWLIVFFSNILGLILPHTPSADWSITLGMALVVFCYVQYEGVKANGLFGHIKHFAGPNLGLALIPITLLIFCIELLSELIKILSLSIRLYGNISAGHASKHAIDNMLPSFPVFGGLILPLELLVAVIQAFVFVLLTCIYLSLVTHHDDEHAEEHAHPAAAA